MLGAVKVCLFICLSGGERGLCCGGMVACRVHGSSHTAQVPGAKHTLQWPQHNDNKQHHECDEDQHPLPICQSVQPAKSPRRPGWSHRRLGGSDVNADAEGRGAVRGIRSGHGFVAQLLPIQPHRLLMLLVDWELAEDLLTGGQGRRSFLRQRGGMAAEGAREASGVVVAVLLGPRDRHEAGEALQAEGVGALQQLGCLEDIVIVVVADGALWLAHD